MQRVAPGRDGVNSGPRSWAASIVGFALAVLAACFALKLAADYLLAALPVLLPAGAGLFVAGIAWRWWAGRQRGW